MIIEMFGENIKYDVVPVRFNNLPLFKNIHILFVKKKNMPSGYKYIST